MVSNPRFSMNKAIRPPKFATQFLRWFCAEELIEEVQGDLEEAYRFRRNKYGKLRADLWFISDVLKFFKPHFLMHFLLKNMHHLC